jgi:hypothetical protein
VNALAVKEAFDRVLRQARLAHEHPQWKSFRSEYQPSIGGAGFSRLPSLIFSGTSVFEDADVLALLRLPFNFLADENEWCYPLNGAPEQQSNRAFTTALSIRCS